MTRLFGYALLACLVCLIFVSLVARAVDQEVQQRVILTRDGVTLDCERRLGPHGSVSYIGCARVP